MRSLKVVLFSLFLLASFGFFLWTESSAVEDASPALITQGRELFNAKDGLKVKFACILCHKGEKAIKKSEVQKLGDKLPLVINKYITGKSKGASLPPDSAEMKALMAYIRYEHSK